MKMLLAAIFTAIIVGCKSGGDEETISSPVPSSGSQSFGYETASGEVVKYGEVDTGDESDGKGTGGYEDRAVAK